MVFTRKYGLLSYALFKGLLKYILPIFKNLRLTVKKANLKVSLEEYAASFITTLILVVPATMLAMFFYLATFVRINVVGIIFLEILTGIFTIGLVYVIYIIYPQYRVNAIKTNLDKYVAFAATHMATIAGTGVPPHVMFQMMGEFKEYGEIAEICKRISRNIIVFGYDTISAISEEAQRTPSHKFKDLLWSIVAVIRTGGDMRQMLIGKSKTLMDEQRRIEAKYIETLSMFAEIYSTVFVAGVVMIFVLVAIMGILGGLPVPVKLLLELTTYVGVPLASIAFIMLIEMSKPIGA
ncbi:MAG: type II secretion system F family protein [Candidatus Diapherotrites archaeon]|nr:type II secretion system F family protein [Candidatus Diapherotrites archaeon]